MTDWNVQGTYMEACNCEAVCPCIFFSPPTEGDCTVLIGWRIDKGSYGDVSLDGLNAALLAYAPGNMKDGGWKVALYTDDRADEKQAEALGAIFSGQAGGHLAALAPMIAEVLGARPALIDFDGSDKSFSLAVEGVGRAEIEAISGQGGGTAQVSGHPLAISPGEPAVVARGTNVAFSDHGLSCEADGRTAMFAPFRYAA
ncbi:DUF1326 domain-containing protein [Minwuia thermotolerans]|uniref:DUF1326 domain-containing protein n=1 Tax=Minwuia thermotolerans TaxID=2056226 RepID=A0A2M9FX25_9PROT|nr:DUF1326 domain-containing protein [Minwuia thermotolerans]PJK28004.1 hypothetical protein CVT23_19275 [Minwuia thermotolerans]